MDSIVQYILNSSKLEITKIRITDATATSFKMSIESKVTNTGPVGATMAPMTVDMIGPKGVFGKLDLPEVKTSSKGATVTVDDQKIDIVDLAAFEAFVKAIQLDEKLTLVLDNGKSTIKAFFTKANITYRKEVELIGMNGPKTDLVKTEVNADGSFTNTLRSHNPSALEIDLGQATFAFKNEAGETVGTQTGKLFITQGETIYTATGKATSKGALTGLKLVGQGNGTDAWTNKTITFFEVPIVPTAELTSAIGN